MLGQGPGHRLAQDPGHGVTTLLGDVRHAKVLEHEDGILNGHRIPPAREKPRERLLKCQWTGTLQHTKTKVRGLVAYSFEHRDRKRARYYNAFRPKVWGLSVEKI